MKDIDEMSTQLAELVGLGHVLNTKVGDAYIRGVSGGERRRVSLAEALATCARYGSYPYRKVGSVANGLDLYAWIILQLDLIPRKR